MSELEATVTIWTVGTHDPRAVVHARRWLAPAELRRAERFLDGPSRNRFVVTRAVLRAILASRLGEPARRVAILEGPHGKPVLPHTASAGHGIAVSVAHAPELSSVAVGALDVMGIDIEPLDRDVAATLPAAVCTALEQAELADLPPDERTPRFLELWVRKEAVAKADGRGLRLPLAELDVSGPVPVAVTVRDRHRRFEVREVDVGPGHTAAVATSGYQGDFQVRPWSWPT
jgi:4'-phosphopantetheinyl transferase